MLVCVREIVDKSNVHENDMTWETTLTMFVSSGIVLLLGLSTKIIIVSLMEIPCTICIFLI